MSSRKLQPQEEKLRRWNIKHRTATVGAVFDIKRENRLQREARRKKLAWIEQAVKEFHENGM